MAELKLLELDAQKQGDQLGIPGTIVEIEERAKKHVIDAHMSIRAAITQFEHPSKCEAKVYEAHNHIWLALRVITSWSEPTFFSCLHNLTAANNKLQNALCALDIESYKTVDDALDELAAANKFVGKARDVFKG